MLGRICPCFSFCKRLNNAVYFKLNLHSPSIAMSLKSNKICNCCRDFFLKENNFFSFYTIREDEIIRNLYLGFNVWPFFSITQHIDYVSGKPTNKYQSTYINLFPLILCCLLLLLKYLLAHMSHAWLFDVINLMYLLFSLLIILLEKPPTPKTWRIEIL